MNLSLNHRMNGSKPNTTDNNKTIKKMQNHTCSITASMKSKVRDCGQTVTAVSIRYKYNHPSYSK